MKPLIIIPDNDKELNALYPIQGRLSYTYLHGQLETDCGYDCYSIANPSEYGFEVVEQGYYIIEDENKSGIIPCIYKDKECTLFLWIRPNFRKQWGGLVVYNDDKEAYNYAIECYNNKESCI